jgi:hypothetical protein
VLPKRRSANHLHDTLPCALPFGHHDRRPVVGSLIYGDLRKIGQAPPPLRAEVVLSLTGTTTRWRPLIEGSVQPKASDEGDRIAQAPATIPKSFITRRTPTPSATTATTISRSGCQRLLTNESNCPRPTRSSSCAVCPAAPRTNARKGPKRTQERGSAQTREEAQGMAANSATHTHLRALVFTKWAWLDLSGSR